MNTKNVKAYFLNVFVTKKRYVFLGIIEIISFLIYYYIASPSNFNSISGILNSYISVLGTLLAIVVSINTFALQNKIGDMSMNRKSLENRLDKINCSLELLLATDINSDYKQYQPNKNRNDSQKEQQFIELLN